MITPISQVFLESIPVLLKREEFNPAESHKGYAADMITRGLRTSGKLQPMRGRKPELVVPSSGNFAKGVAYYTQDDDVEVIAVTDVLSPVEFQNTLRAFKHVSVKVVNRPEGNGSHMKARMEVVQQLRKANPHVIEINQYRDWRVPLAYEQTLVRDLDRQTGGEIGAVFVAAGTGGLANGVLKYKEKYRRPWQVFCADARGSSLFWQPPPGVKRHLSGYGNAQPTDLIREVSGFPYAFRVVHVDDTQAIATCHRLWHREGILVGPSGGAVMAAVEMVLRHRPDLIPDFGHVVVILSDSGKNYRTTIYSDDWLIANGFGQVVSQRIQSKEHISCPMSR